MSDPSPASAQVGSGRRKTAILEPPEGRSPPALLEVLLDPVENPLDPVEATLDASPAGGDQIDEEREILDTGLSLGLQLSLKSLEATDRLRRESSHLGEVASHRQDLGAERVVERLGHPLGERRLELRGALGERLEPNAGTVERRLQGRLVRPLARERLEAHPRALDRVGVHGRDCTVAGG